MQVNCTIQHRLKFPSVCVCVFQQQGPLLDLPLFIPDTLRWCTMHVLNLGVCLWAAGSTMRVLLNKYRQIWAGHDIMLSDNDRLSVAYEAFRKWTRENKIPKLASLIIYTLINF